MKRQAAEWVIDQEEQKQLNQSGQAMSAPEKLKAVNDLGSSGFQVIPVK